MDSQVGSVQKVNIVDDETDQFPARGCARELASLLRFASFQEFNDLNK